MLKLLSPPLKQLASRARDLHRRALDSEQLAFISRMTGGPESQVITDAIPFQDPIDEICEEHAPKYMRSTHYVIMGLFVTLILVSSLVSVDIVVVGTGRLTTETPPIMLQPVDRAIVRELNVKVGDTVTKGQVLATLDPTFTQADMASLTAQQRSLLAQMRRLEAELEGRALETPPMPSADEQLQNTLYLQRQAQYASQLRFYDEELRRRHANIQTMRDERDSQAKQLVIAKDVEAMRAEMAQKQVGSRLNLLEAQSVRMRIEQSHQDAINRLTELEHDLQSKEAEKQSFMDSWRNKILEDLVATRIEAAKVGEGLNKATLLNDLVIVTAPQDGVILDVAKRSVGSVLREAEPIITMIASNADLIAEVMVNSADVGYAKPGDEVVLKVDSFPYQRHGFLEGRLQSISEESFQPGGPNSVLPVPTRGGMSGAYHRGMVQLMTHKLDAMPEGARLFPGMTLSAEIKVGSRSVMSYFLYPITRGFSESMREP